MATIPIEVIVQDVEAPVVPSEDGANTNTNTGTSASIAVPDTGGSGSNIFTGSTSSIILPAILLALAIGSIAAIPIRKYHKQKKDKTTRKEKLAIATSSVIAVLAVTALVGNLVIPATKAATSDTTDGIVPAEDKVSIVITRDGSSVEVSTKSTATITSTSDFGYKVALSMADGVETSNLYLDGDTTSEHYIASTESTELTDNTWGYTITEDGEYAAVPLLDNATTVAQGDGAVEDESLSIYYGVKVGSDLPAGTYSGGEIEYTFVELGPTIDDVTYMQDFAALSTNSKAGVLDSMTEDEQYILIDARDKKPYYISKLRDGNVWMTQNLDLDLDETKTLTPADTNVAENWTPMRSTISFIGDTIDGWEMDYTSPYSADPEDVYAYSGQTYYSEEACLEAGHNDCAHHHVGNYYNWPAAVATNDASGLTEGDTNAPTSICPAGWRLPRGRTSDGSWAPISEMYVLLAEYITFGSPNPGGYPISSEAYNTITSSPIWLTPNSGNVSYNGSINHVYTSLWTGTITTSQQAAVINLQNSNFQADGYGNRFGGSSVRCLAQ